MMKTAGLLQRALHEWFWRHPNEAGETYSQHCAAALCISAKFAFTAVAAFVHAFLPCAFETTASEVAKQVLASIALRQKRVD